MTVRPSKKLMLVEGKSDFAFYAELCKKLGLETEVKIAPPKEAGGKANNREGVFNCLPALLKQFDDGRLERLAVVVDADYDATHGLGYLRTLDRLATILSKSHFSLRTPQTTPGGLLFKSAAGFRDLGIWVMPGFRKDGMLEDWVRSCIVSEDAELLAYASHATAHLPAAKFKPLHKTKAEVAAWLAWQAAPGRGLENAVLANLLDPNKNEYLALAQWLNAVYS